MNFPSEGSQQYGEGRAEHHELYPLSLMEHRMASQDCNKRSRQDLLTKAQAWKTKAERKRKREGMGEKSSTTKIIPKGVVHNTQWGLLKTARLF